MGQAEADAVVDAHSAVGGNLLIRAGEGGQILIESAGIFLRLREAEQEFYTGAFKTSVDIAEGDHAAIRHGTLPPFVHINEGFFKSGVGFRIVNYGSHGFASLKLNQSSSCLRSEAVKT